GRSFVGIGAGRFDRTCRIHRKAVTFIDAIDVDRGPGSRSIRSRRRTDDRSDGATQEHRSNEVLQTATEDLRHDAAPGHSAQGLGRYGLKKLSALHERNRVGPWSIGPKSIGPWSNLKR